MKKASTVTGLCVLVLCIGAVVWLAGSVSAQNSRKLMNLQGRLTDTEGNPTTGQHLFELRIYDAGPAGSGNPLYYEAQLVEVNKGIYNVLVGDGYTSFGGDNPDNYAEAGGKTGGIPATVFNRDDLWLEIEIDEDNPLDPRTRVVSSAYAFNADTLDGRDWDSAGDISATDITAAAISASDLTVGDMSADTISFTGGGELDSATVTDLTDGNESTAHTHPQTGGTALDRLWDVGSTGCWVAVTAHGFNKESASSKLRVRWYSRTYQGSSFCCGFGPTGSDDTCRIEAYVDATRVWESGYFTDTSWALRGFDWTSSASQFGAGRHVFRVRMCGERHRFGWSPQNCYVSTTDIYGNGTYDSYVQVEETL